MKARSPIFKCIDEGRYCIVTITRVMCPSACTYLICVFCECMQYFSPLGPWNVWSSRVNSRPCVQLSSSLRLQLVLWGKQASTSSMARKARTKTYMHRTSFADMKFRQPLGHISRQLPPCINTHHLYAESRRALGLPSARSQPTQCRSDHRPMSFT